MTALTRAATTSCAASGNSAIPVRRLARSIRYSSPSPPNAPGTFLAAASSARSRAQVSGSRKPRTVKSPTRLKNSAVGTGTHPGFETDDMPEAVALAALLRVGLHPRHRAVELGPVDNSKLRQGPRASHPGEHPRHLRHEGVESELVADHLLLPLEAGVGEPAREHPADESLGATALLQQIWRDAVEELLEVGIPIRLVDRDPGASTVLEDPLQFHGHGHVVERRAALVVVEAPGERRPGGGVPLRAAEELRP